MTMPALADIFRYQAYEDDAPSKPWALGPWVWATQGQFLVALRTDGIDVDPTPEAKRKAIRYLEDTPADVVSVSLPALRAFVGPVVPDKTCDECDGTGYQDWSESVTCEHCGQTTRLECGECGGDGKAGPPIRLARVAGVPLNLQLLAYALQFVPADETCELGSIESLPSAVRKPEEHHYALLVIGQAWRIAVMNVSNVAATVPQFAPMVPR